MNKTIFSCLTLLALAIFVSAPAYATSVFSTSSLTGDVSITGFADGTPATFSSTYSNLNGTVNATAVADGEYNVYAQGAASFTGFPGAGGTIGINIASPQLIYTGDLSSTGLTAGSYSFMFGTPIGVDVPFSFSLSYDGNASPQVMAGLNLLGFPFVNPDGAGTLAVSGQFNANGTSAFVNFTETNLTWAGFGATLLGADQLFGGSNGIIDGNFTLTNADVTVAPVPEPSTMLLLGCGLLGLGFARKRFAKK